MFSEFVFYLYIIVFAIAHGILVISIIFALLGYFDKDEGKRSKHYALSAKILLIYALMFVVGFGVCTITLML